MVQIHLVSIVLCVQLILHKSRKLIFTPDNGQTDYPGDNEKTDTSGNDDGNQRFDDKASELVFVQLNEQLILQGKGGSALHLHGILANDHFAKVVVQKPFHTVHREAEILIVLTEKVLRICADSFVEHPDKVEIKPL